jgi:hypothetical protein
MNTWGGKRKGAGRKRSNNWSFEEAKKLRANGLTFKEIAKILNASSLEAVFEMFKKFGLTKKRPATIKINYNWEKILQEGKIFITTSRNRDFRCIKWHRVMHVYSHILWNYHHPDDTVKSGELIHHKNLNSLDDVIENYEKMTIGEHSTLHKMGKKIKTPSNIT